MFLGLRNDVSQLMQAMDVFLLPSLYEGLPMVGVEAQLTGLPCMFSDTITNELKISNVSCFLNNNNADIWADGAIVFTRDRRRNNSKIDRDKFDISQTAKDLESTYLTMAKVGEDS